jgi:hypothetical protein
MTPSQKARNPKPGLGVLTFTAVLVAVVAAVWRLHGRAWPALIAVGLVAGVGIPASRWWVRKRKAILLSDRESLTVEEIFSKFYGSSGISKAAVVQLWEEVATTLGYDASRMRPTDRFGVELKEFQFMDGEVDSLSAIAHERMKQHGLNIDWSKVATVDDYIRAFGPHLRT